MMNDDSVMMKEMADMMVTDSKMMTEKGTKYNDAELTDEAKVASDTLQLDRKLFPKAAKKLPPSGGAGKTVMF